MLPPKGAPSIAVDVDAARLDQLLSSQLNILYLRLGLEPIARVQGLPMTLHIPSLHNHCVV